MKALALMTNEADAMIVGKIDDSFEGKKMLVNAFSNPGRLGERINTELILTNYMIKNVQGNLEVDDETGEVTGTDIKRLIILITKEGEAFSTLSKGIYESLQNIVTLFGTPDKWGDGLTVKVKMFQVGQGKKYTLEMI